MVTIRNLLELELVMRFALISWKFRKSSYSQSDVIGLRRTFGGLFLQTVERINTYLFVVK